MSDILASARKAAVDASISGVGAPSLDMSATSGVSDIFAAARLAAEEVSESGVARSVTSNVSAAAQSDLFGAAMHAAAEVQSSIVSGADSKAVIRNSAGPQQNSQFILPTLRHRDDLSQLSARDDQSEGGDSDIFAAARRVAAETSRSGVTAGSKAPSEVAALNDIFAPACSGKVSSRVASAEQGAASSRSGRTTSDRGEIFGFMRDAAMEVSESSGLMATQSKQDKAQSDISSGLDLAKIAHSFADGAASEDASASGVESDLFGFAREAAAEASRSGVGSRLSSDIFSAALHAAGAESRSGVSSQSRNVSVRPSGLAKSIPLPSTAPRQSPDQESRPKPRHFAPAGRHTQAPPSATSQYSLQADVKSNSFTQPATVPQDLDVDQPPWVLLSLPGLPAPPRSRHPSPAVPPGVAPPLPEGGFIQTPIISVSNPSPRENHQEHLGPGIRSDEPLHLPASCKIVAPLTLETDQPSIPSTLNPAASPEGPTVNSVSSTGTVLKFAREVAAVIPMRPDALRSLSLSHSSDSKHGEGESDLGMIFHPGPLSSQKAMHSFGSSTTSDVRVASPASKSDLLQLTSALPVTKNSELCAGGSDRVPPATFDSASPLASSPSSKARRQQRVDAQRRKGDHGSKDYKKKHLRKAESSKSLDD